MIGNKRYYPIHRHIHLSIKMIDNDKETTMQREDNITIKECKRMHLKVFLIRIMTVMKSFLGKLDCMMYFECPSKQSSAPSTKYILVLSGYIIKAKFVK